MAQPPTDVPAHEIVIAQTEQERQDCFDVRIEVFHHEQKFPLDTEIDSMEDLATHFLLRLTPSLVPIGTIRGYKQPGATHYKLSRLAVLKEYRQFKFGRALVLALHDWVRLDAIASSSQLPARGDGDGSGGNGGNDIVVIVSHSQLPVKAFYAKFGYIPEGDEFDEDGDPHQKMVLRLRIH